MTHHQTKQSQRGYTLTEVLVAVAVFAIIFIAALVAYDRANRIFKSSVDASDVQQTTRVAFDRLVAEVRMAGFDFDRDGFPMGTRKYQQPDEQLEFIHPHAVTIRTNLNYETAAASDNGRETAYEPGFGTATADDDFFPVVTTANNEIVTYVLKSDSGPNDDTISFFADVAMPRQTFPDTGGANETQVQISGVDLCQDAGGVLTGCLNPPYTLYRIALKSDGTPDTPVPIANNLRSMTFSYFADALSTVAVTPNGGVGQFIVTGGTTPAASIAARELRAGIRSVRLNLIGMSPGSDPAYVDPIEAALPLAQQVATARRHRQYQLRSSIVPRNLGKRGVQEIDTRIPGAPSIRRVCAEGCGVPRIEWDAPSVGYVSSYVVFYDISATGAFNSPETNTQQNLYAYVENLDPNTTYYFRVKAKNDFGESDFSPVSLPVTPLNRTKPQKPAILSVTGNAAGPAAVPNDIIVTWRPPNANVGNPLNSCSFPAGAPFFSETKRYKLYRSTTSGFTPDDATNLIWSGTPHPTNPPAVQDSQSGIVTFTDSSAKLACTPYYYKVIGIETCNNDPNLNVPTGTDLAISDASDEMDGTASAGGAPLAPVNVHTTIASTCSTNPCSIVLEWNQVSEDVNNKPIVVTNYHVRRETYVSGVLSATAPPVDVVDTNLADGIVTYTDNPPPPGVTTVYHYAVSASHCPTGVLTSAYSTPDAKFPCSILVASPDPGSVMEGDGTTAASAWLLNNSTATITVDSSTILATATAIVSDVAGGAGTPIAASLSNGNQTATFSYSMPGASGVFRIDMQFTDVSNCGSTVTRYVQESPTPCCLLPYKLDATTIFDSTVLTLATNTLTVTLKNQCDVPLTIDTFRMQWTFGPAGNDLRSATYLDVTPTIIDDFGGVVDVDGLAAFDPRTVSAPITIPANGTYRVALEFQRNATTLNTLTNFCVRYSTPSALALDDCRVVQIPGTTCP